jgi:hypothetical protein
MRSRGRLKRGPETFRSLTGLTPADFGALLAHAEPAWHAAQRRRRERPGRAQAPLLLKLTDPWPGPLTRGAVRASLSASESLPRTPGACW